MLDEEMWFMGAYVHNAVLSAVEKNLAGKKAKTNYLEKPFMQEQEETETKAENKTDKEKEENMKKVKAVFQSLEILKANFELSKQG